MLACSIFLQLYIDDCIRHVITVHVIQLVKSRYIYIGKLSDSSLTHTESLYPFHLIFRVMTVHQYQSLYYPSNAQRKRR